jgi:cell division protein FtsI/penicillin-binding protein 2
VEEGENSHRHRQHRNHENVGHIKHNAVDDDIHLSIDRRLQQYAMEEYILYGPVRIFVCTDLYEP